MLFLVALLSWTGYSICYETNLYPILNKGTIQQETKNGAGLGFAPSIRYMLTYRGFSIYTITLDARIFGVWCRVRTYRALGARFTV